VLAGKPESDAEKHTPVAHGRNLVGSLRRDSFNRKIANVMEGLAPERLTFKHVEMGGLPLYNEDELKTLKTENARLKMLLSLP
jgi:chromate reductase, NAD(P)H dehydrogenase (quinone)